MDYLFNFLIQDYQQIALFGIVLYLIVKITITLDRFYVETKKLHDKVPNMERLLAKIDAGLSSLNDTLLEKSIIDKSCYSRDRSPRTVNELGEKLFKESGADAVYLSMKEELAQELALKPIKSLLQLQTESLNVMLAHRDDSAFLPLQNFVYQHPTYNDTPLAYTDVLFVMALKLRDFYLTKHPNLNAGL
jgi:hypothetical protein